ncbi:CHAT domain-containing protein [Aquimarina sp. Aq107]|uniref:CHAT domain-containing protein n=1 Tax=Aquimarina sp. Aq107 TaxID=1191912 RepID=UPI000D551FF2|nr:CHAT domain-containing protein [Aquimarina sp. Aq107]
MNSLKTIVFFLFFSSLSFSQTKIVNDTILAFQYFKKADSLLADRKLDSSIVYFRKALPIYEKAKAWERVATCYNTISESQIRKSQYEEALKSAKKALEICNYYLIQNHREEGAAYNYIGESYVRMSDFDNALKNHKKSLEVKQKNTPLDYKSIAVSYSNLGLLYRDLSDYRKAISFLDKALAYDLKFFGENHERVGNDYHNLANVYIQDGNYFKAGLYFNKSLNIVIKNKGKNHLSTGYSYYGLASYYSTLKQYDTSLEYYQKALSIFKKNESLYPLFAVYTNIGLVLSNKGEYNNSIKFHKKSLEIGRKILDEENVSLGFVYWNMGLDYERKEEYDTALNYYEKALKICKKSYGENHSDIADLYKNIGNVYRAKKELNKALNYQNKSLKIYKNVYKENNPKISTSYTSIASIFLEQKKFSEALTYSKNALELIENSYGNRSPLIIEALNQNGLVYKKQGDYKKAIMFFEKAVVANTKHDQEYFNPKMLIESYRRKAEVLQLLYYKNKSKNDLNENIKIYSNLNVLIDHSRQSFQEYEDKLLFAKETKEIFTSAIKGNILLYKENKMKESLSNAFYYAEKSKSNTLKDILNHSNAKNFSGLSIKIIKLEKKLRIDKAFCQSKINEEISNKKASTKLSNYESKLFDISRRQDSLTEVIEKKYPKYHQLKYTTEVVSVADVQEKLDEETTLLEFFTTDSITYAFTISKNKIAVKELLTPKLEQYIEEFQGAITKNYEVYKEVSHRLYKKLIAPVKDEFVGNQLIIVPDGSLWHLNFDLLLTAEDTSDNPKTWPYLLKEYAISYANSATLLFRDEIDEGEAPKELQECLAFSFSSGDNISNTRNVSLKAFRNSSMDLPGTREEIKAISNIVDGQYFYGSEATEQNFKKHVGAYNILHLALHGDVDNERPENSKLYFTKSKDTIEDNYLYSHELFALDIPAELTVLSACNTGTGKIAKGEGIMSLGNAFQYAGTKSLLLTNWEVSDETTPKIMEYFYTSLRDGKNKAEALQQAKLQFLTTTNQETDHPYYWGGFYLLGDTAAIQLESNNYGYWFIGVGILVLILVSLLWYRKRNSPLERG